MKMMSTVSPDVLKIFAPPRGKPCHMLGNQLTLHLAERYSLLLSFPNVPNWLTFEWQNLLHHVTCKHSPELKANNDVYLK